VGEIADGSGLTGRMTVSYLQHRLADGQAFVERVGAENVNHELLVTLAAMESAINLIEAERLNYNPHENNSPHQP
jgi:hypothetical protein